MLLQGCIAPHFFEPVKLPGIRKHHMHHYVHIVYQYPLKGLKTFMMIRVFAANFLYFMLNVFSYCFDLRLVPGFTNNKKVRYGFINLTQIKRNYIFPLLFLYSCNNG